MQRIAFGVVLGAMLAASSAVLAQAPSWTPPPENQRCPSKWGADDERGSGNHMKPQTVLNAVKLIKTGEVIELGYVLNANMPFFGTRRFDVHVKRTFMNEFANRRGSNEEIIISEIGQVGTQFDGFANQTYENSWYNCFKVAENATRSGFTKLGVHNVGALITRGVLIDVAQGRRDARRYLRDHGRGSRGRAEEAEHHATAGRRHHHQYRLGQAVGQGLCTLCQAVSGHRRRGCRVTGCYGRYAALLRQLAGRGGAGPWPEGFVAGASNRAGRERRASARESQARRAGG